MLTACFDASGKPEDQCMVVAGFCSLAGGWHVFEERWQRRLEEDDLAYFHAVDFAHSKRAFREGWKGNDTRCNRLRDDLMDIIRSCELRRFGRLVDLGDFDVEYWRDKISGLSADDAFGFCAKLCIDDLLEYAQGEGLRDNVRYVFEKGDDEDRLMKVLRYFNYDDADFTWGRSHTDRKGVRHAPFVGLQAADWLAYEYYLDLKRLFYQPQDLRPRWALEQFERLPGRMIHSSISAANDVAKVESPTASQ